MIRAYPIGNAAADITAVAISALNPSNGDSVPLALLAVASVLTALQGMWAIAKFLAAPQLPTVLSGDDVAVEAARIQGNRA